jgi:hypothetical protein
MELTRMDGVMMEGMGGTMMWATCWSGCFWSRYSFSQWRD